MKYQFISRDFENYVKYKLYNLALYKTLISEVKRAVKEDWDMYDIPERNSISLKAKDGHMINVYCWNKVERPIAVLQIFHGMAEHAGRYNKFANSLNNQEIAVFGDDHRGHGQTAILNGKPGVIGKDGFNKIVEDEYMITNMIKNKYPKTPVYIFAHSFGSFIGQEYITRYGSEIDGIILCGTAAQIGFEFRLAKILAFLQMKIFGEEEKATFLEFLSFGSYNKKINISDGSNWLSRDTEEVFKYSQDKSCGFTCSIGFYYYFIDGLLNLYKKNKLISIPKTLPVYIIAGQEDPVGQYGSRVEKLYEIYKKTDLTDLNMKLYKDCRHELLNELNREEVTDDVLRWIGSHLKKK